MSDIPRNFFHLNIAEQLSLSGPIIENFINKVQPPETIDEINWDNTYLQLELEVKKIPQNGILEYKESRLKELRTNLAWFKAFIGKTKEYFPDDIEINSLIIQLLNQYYPEIMLMYRGYIWPTNPPSAARIFQLTYKELLNKSLEKHRSKGES